jgi:hypothetical protein
MVKVLEEAVAKITALPETDQEQIGRELLEHVEKLQALRADLQAGIDSLNAGRGQELDIGDIIERARSICQALSYRSSFPRKQTSTSFKSGLSGPRGFRAGSRPPAPRDR